MQLLIFIWKVAILCYYSLIQILENNNVLDFNFKIKIKFKIFKKSAIMINIS